MKNLFAALLALIFLFAFHAPAEDAWDRDNTLRTPAEISGDWEYIVLPDCTAEITSYNGAAETLDIPSELDGHAVTGIGDGAFYWCDALTSVTIPEGVTSIGYEAFAWCDALTSVTIPSSVTFIGERAFAVCADELTLTVPKDSCAEEYCRDNDLKYICPETSDR